MLVDFLYFPDDSFVERNYNQLKHLNKFNVQI